MVHSLYFVQIFQTNRNRVNLFFQTVFFVTFCFSVNNLTERRMIYFFKFYCCTCTHIMLHQYSVLKTLRNQILFGSHYMYYANS